MDSYSDSYFSMIFVNLLSNNFAVLLISLVGLRLRNFGKVRHNPLQFGHYCL